MVLSYYAGDTFPIDEIWEKRRVKWSQKDNADLTNLYLTAMPDEPDGIYFGQYSKYHGKKFFFVGHEERGKPTVTGKFFWHENKRSSALTPLPIELMLELYGGLGALMSRSMGYDREMSLEEIWSSSLQHTLGSLLEEIEEEYLNKGNWLNLCATIGAPEEEIFKSAGIKRMVHVGNDSANKRRYLASSINGQVPYSQSYILADVNFLDIGELNKRIGKGELDGILMLHPPGDPNIISSCFKIASGQLKPGGYIVLALDTYDLNHVEEAAKKYNFKLVYENNGMSESRVIYRALDNR